MNAMVAVEVVAVLGMLAVFALAVWYWGPGEREHIVKCPEKKINAKVLVEQREGDFGRLRMADIERCSLLPEGPVACDKACLSHL